MRRLGFIGILSSALVLGVTAGAFAASSPAVAPTGRSVAVVARNHVWTAMTAFAPFRASAKITITSTYTSGKVRVVVTGVKKGDVVKVSIVAKPKTGKSITVTSDQVTVSGTGTSTTITWVLSPATSKKIKADLKAGDHLVLGVRDGTKRTSATFKGG